MSSVQFPDHEAIEKQHSSTISRLLAEPSQEAMQEFYFSLIKSNNYKGFEVNYIGPKIGKGVFATKDFEKDEVILKENMLVGAQHTKNKMDALVCSFCFRFIGSIELQIGRHLTFMKETGSTLNVFNGSTEQLQATSSGACDDASDTSSNSSDNGFDHTHDHHEHSSVNIDLPAGLIESLVTEMLDLPYSELFPLPSIVKCLGGCQEELFCSETCAKTAWDSYHSMLCMGPKSLCKNRDMLFKFNNYANETNDIFLVAAKVISGTMLRASSLKKETHSEETDSMLFQAWNPFSMGFKRLWWESLALPEDVGPDEEFEFRNQIKELASHSLNLLKGAIFEEEYAALFSLQVYGHIIGMFELNNLDLVVASPVEDYFIYIDDLPVKEKEEAEKVTKPLLDALGEEYDIPCQGTAFYSIQSCINHSCSPNVKAFKRDEDKDGQAVLLVTKPIKNGDEITISYIDENASFKERKSMLEDYGFTCSCCRCLGECNGGML